MALIDMQTMRYINLLDRASRVKTTKCFVYNNSVIFAVQKFMVSKAIGPDAINVRKIQEQLGKRVRIIVKQMVWLILKDLSKILFIPSHSNLLK